MEGNPYHIHRGLEDLEDREDQEDLADPSLVVGKGETCWGFESLAHQEGLKDWGRRVPVPGEIVPRRSGC